MNNPLIEKLIDEINFIEIRNSEQDKTVDEMKAFFCEIAVLVLNDDICMATLRQAASMMKYYKRIVQAPLTTSKL